MIGRPLEMHPTEWIAKNARFQRTLSPGRLRKALNRQSGECTWCGKQIGSKARRWCSETCRTEGYVRNGMWHYKVKHRDKGVCAICGFDSLAAQSRVKRIMQVAKRNRRHFTFSRLRKFSRRTRIYSNNQPYEIDHIVPVCEGGGCCGLDNLRTLCFVCHSRVTAELSKRRAAERRDKQRPLLCGE